LSNPSTRALLKWSQQDLARRSKLFIGIVKDFEREKSNPVDATLLAIEQAFHEAGVVFIHADRKAGAGVRFASP
jgi:transcriptional regulator with XRE-family HTH domain